MSKKSGWAENSDIFNDAELEPFDPELTEDDELEGLNRNQLIAMKLYSQEYDSGLDRKITNVLYLKHKI